MDIRGCNGFGGSGSVLCWDQVHSALWLQIMTSTRALGGDRSHNSHMQRASIASAGFCPMVGQPGQPWFFCWEFNSQGVCNKKS